MTTLTKQPVSLIKQTKAAIEKYKSTIEDWNRPKELLYTFFERIQLFAIDVPGEAVFIMENLIKFFMNPTIATAYVEQLSESDAKDVATALVELHRVFKHMEHPKAEAYIDLIHLEYIADRSDKQRDHISNMFRKYSILNEVEQQQEVITERVNKLPL